MKNNHFLQKLLDYLLLSTFIIFPFLINLSLISPKDPGHPLVAVNFSLADLLIGITLFLWIIKVTHERNVREIKLPPKPVFWFLGAGILSFVNAFSISDWLKEVVQLTEYLFLYYILLLNNLKNIKVQLLKNLLFITTSLVLVLGFIQYAILDGSPYLVRGLFENRNVLGVFLCIVVPLAYAEILTTVSVIKKAWMFAILILTIFVTLSGTAIISMAIGIFAVSYLNGKKVFIRTSLLIVLLGVTYPFIMPAKNKTAVGGSLSFFEQGSLSENYYRRLTILGNLEKTTLFKKNIGENYLLVTNDLFMSAKLPPIRKGNAYKDEEGKMHIKNLYLEMQASLNLISEHTLLGVGLGNFQNVISTFYKGFKKINTAEPAQHNGYLVVASTTGVLGLAAFMWIFGFFIKSSLNVIRKKNEYILTGIIGSLIAIAIQNNFSDVLIAPMIVPLIILFFITHKCAE